MAAVTIDIHVDDLDAVMALYDRIQVWRSSAEFGTYFEVTADAATAADVVGTIDGPWDINGLTLVLTLNGTDPITVQFAAANPVALASFLSEVNAAVAGLAAESGAGTNRPKLTSALTGTGSSILVSGTSMEALGFPTTKVNGKGVRLALTDPTTEYKFIDFDGEPTFWYKTRFYSTLTGRVSEYSAPRQGTPQVVLASSLLATGTIDLATADGRPVAFRRIIVVPLENIRVPSSTYAVLPGFERVIATTDAQGKASINLVRGMKVRLFVEGSNFFRDFAVPDVASFDIMQVATSQPDSLSIVQAPPRPIRVS